MTLVPVTSMSDTEGYYDQDRSCFISTSNQLDDFYTTEFENHELL